MYVLAKTLVKERLGVNFVGILCHHFDSECDCAYLEHTSMIENHCSRHKLHTFIASCYPLQICEMKDR